MARADAREFELKLVDFEEVHQLPGDWPDADLRSLLELLEIEGVSDAELLDMALMGLQDREVDEAADLVLQVVFGDDMSRGVRQNLIDDLQDDRPWEELADIRRQRGVFTAVTLLQQAFPKEFGKPDCTRIQIEITPDDPHGLRWLSGEIEAALLLRLLAAGMQDRALLRRLYGDALAGNHFPEAPSILWQVDRSSEPGVAPVSLTLHSSVQWFAPLEDAAPWTAKGWKDAPPKEEDED